VCTALIADVTEASKVAGVGFVGLRLVAVDSAAPCWPPTPHELTANNNSANSNTRISRTHE
jgi:hypothetical protein